MLVPYKEGSKYVYDRISGFNPAEDSDNEGETCFSEAPRVGGTLVWYYLICKRQVWLMARGVEADKDDESLALGRLIDESSYKRIRHSVSFGDSKFDLLKEESGVLVIGEIKRVVVRLRLQDCNWPIICMS